MGSGKFAVDHDHFVLKNKMLAAAEENDRRDKARGAPPAQATGLPQKASCFNCKLKKKCVVFKGSRTGYSTGAASFGGDQRMICAKYDPAPVESRAMSDKQIKALQKNFRL